MDCVQASKTRLDPSKLPTNTFLHTISLCELSYNDNLSTNCILISNHETDAQCKIFFEVSNINTLYIVFRGTSSLQDWKTDLKIRQDTLLYNDVKVHRGFLEQYLSIHTDIMKHLTSVINYTNNIIITGHSLGGALATICAVYLKENPNLNKYNISVYTYGSPRVGNKKFKKLYNKHIKESYRIAGHSDLITYFPMNSSYTHVHPAISYNDNIAFLFKKLSIPSTFRRFFNTLKNMDITANSHKLSSYHEAISTFHKYKI